MEETGEAIKKFAKRLGKVFLRRFLPPILAVILIIIIIAGSAYVIMKWVADSVAKAAGEYITNIDIDENGVASSAITAQELWDNMIKQGYEVNKYLDSPEELEQLMNAELVTQLPDTRSNVDEPINWDAIFNGSKLQAAEWYGDEPEYIEHMKQKVEWYEANRPGVITNNWACMIDADLCRLTIFQKRGSKWELVVAWNTFQGTNGSPGGPSDMSSYVGPRSHSFKGIHHVGGKVGDTITCYVMIWWQHGTSHDNCQRFEPSYDRGDPDNVPVQNRFLSHGCCNLTEDKARWINREIPINTAVIVFDAYNPLPGNPVEGVKMEDTTGDSKPSLDYAISEDIPWTSTKNSNETDEENDKETENSEEKSEEENKEENEGKTENSEEKNKDDTKETNSEDTLTEEEKSKISKAAENSDLTTLYKSSNYLRGIIRFKRHDENGKEYYMTYASPEEFRIWQEEYHYAEDEETREELRDLLSSHFTLKKSARKSSGSAGGNLVAAENDVIVPGVSEKILNATENVPFQGVGWCLGWVDSVYENAGMINDEDKSCCAYRAFERHVVSTDISAIPIGAAIYGTGSGRYTCSTCGNGCGHVGIYVGNGQVRDNWDCIRTVSIEEWEADQKGVINGKQGILGWGWEDGDKTRGTTEDPSVNKSNNNSNKNQSSKTNQNSNSNSNKNQSSESSSNSNTSTTSSGVHSIEDVISAAESQIGQPYNGTGSFADEDGWENGAEGFNCSGLVWWAFEQAGFEDVPHSQCAGYPSMIDIVKENNGGSLITDESQLQRGDLLFYNTGDGRESGHVAIYLGDGKRIHSGGYGVGVAEDDNALNGSCIGGGPLFLNVSRAATNNTDEYSSAPGYQAVIATFTEIEKSVDADGPDYEAAAEAFGVPLDTGTEYILKTTTINYEDLVQPYTLQFDFLWALLVIGQSKEFVMDVAKLAYKSDLEVSVYDNVTTTTDTDNWTYDEIVNARIEGKVYYGVIKEEVFHKHKPFSKTPGHIYRTVVTSTDTVNYALTRANTWIADYKKEYKSNTTGGDVSYGGKDLETQYIFKEKEVDPSNDTCGKIQEAKKNVANKFNNAQNQSSGGNGGELIDAGDVKEAVTMYMTKKRDNIHDSTEDSVVVQKYTSTTENSIIKDDKKTAPNFVTLFNLYKYRQNRNNILSATEWLFEIMEENGKLSNTLQYFKYLLYKATGVNYGVTELDPNMFKPGSYKPASSGQTGGAFLEFMKAWEGADTDAAGHYIVADVQDGCRTVGFGVTLEYDGGRFASRGINVSGWGFGDCCFEAHGVSNEIIDEICVEALDDFKNTVREQVASCSPALNEQQIDALAAVSYQYGGIGNFVEMWNQYGNTDALRDNVHQTGRWAYYFRQNPSIGRAEANWSLFHDGIYLDKDGNSL